MPKSGNKTNGYLNTESHSEILIIGAGTFGTSAAYHLSKIHHSPSSITLIDRGLPNNVSEQAASNDINKIIRADYSSAFYMDLAFEAMDAWNSWAELNGKGYYHRTGWIHLSKPGNDLGERIRKNYSARGHDPTSDMSLDEVKTRFGGIFKGSSLDGFEKAYYNPLSGWCDAAMATSEMINIAIRHGVEYVGSHVKRLCLGPNGLEAVETEDGKRYSADKILLATGAWTSSLMTSLEDELGLEDRDRIESQVMAAGVCVAHFKLTDEEVSELKDMPVVIYSDKGDIQPPPRSCNFLKFTNGASFTNHVETTTGHYISQPPLTDQFSVPEKLKQETIDKVTSKVLPEYTNRGVTYWRQCWDSISLSQDHLITKHPDPRLQNLYFAIGGSFHSYKFLPTIGYYVANVLYGKSNGPDKDSHWAWKSNEFNGQGAHKKAYPTRELVDLL